ncbi:MAG: hypothetical protein JJ957_02665 [Pseudomonadales bacterium]|nr:hypothetical protein [Pseudomonadales bacterium]MBO6563991.1 hypothetical protein [Pseudomonadales bacterium]MBO6594714.1 hypothetical protein [Pseudomonadales bacterium]MBO6821726.1 hypothetical protein [Pseudomonadales bacterium]
MLTVLLLLWLVSFPAAADEAPAWVSALDEIAFVVKTPAESPEDWLMAHVDVETTGLIPGYHEMIDIGVIVTDLSGDEQDRLFLRIMPEHPERTQPGAAAVNGFSSERWEDLGYVTTEAAVKTLIDFHMNARGSKQLLFTGFNAWFDISFVDDLFRTQDRSWRELYHYFVLDLPSMAWSLGFQDLASASLARKLGLEPETTDPMRHNGITGAESNVAIYRALINMQPQ